MEVLMGDGITTKKVKDIKVGDVLASGGLGPTGYWSRRYISEMLTREFLEKQKREQEEKERLEAKEKEREEQARKSEKLPRRTMMKHDKIALRGCERSEPAPPQGNT